MSQLSFDQLCQAAECLVEPEAVQSAIKNLAQQVNGYYRELLQPDCELVVWAVLNGGLVFTGHLLPRLKLTLRLDYIHATRYHNNEGGEQLQWHAKPVQSVAGKHVLICDDIFDAGITLKAISDYARAQGAKTVQCAVLANKLVARPDEMVPPKFQALSLVGRYVFGMGLDYHHHWRNLPGIWALREGE